MCRHATCRRLPACQPFFSAQKVSEQVQNDCQSERKKKLSFHTHTRARRFATPPPAAAKKKKTNKLEKHNQTFILRVTKSHIILVLPSAIGVSMLNDESHYTQYSFSQSEKHTTNKTVCVAVLRPRMQVKAIHKIEMEMSIKCVETHLALIILYVRHKHIYCTHA